MKRALSGAGARSFVPDMKRGKLLNDPIHGYISLDPDILKIIDTPQFQRLRDLKQLGSCYMLFPGASHNRFEHSVGVSYLAGVLLHHLRQHQPELNITDREIFLVKCAGLCHDLGHGPFSHVFDNEFIPRARPGIEWSHEEASTMMLNAIIDENKLDFTDQERKFLVELINPYTAEGKEQRQFPERAFLYDIVANARNSVDVDKWDYLARDCYNIGLKSSYDFQRLVMNCRVIAGQICFHKKEVYNLYEMFHTRFSLFKQVYSHRVSKALEYMISDVLLLADPVLRISHAIRDPKAYCNLTDCVLKQIEVSADARLAPAQRLIERIRRRQLYKMVSETVLSPEHDGIFPVTEEQIVAHSGGVLKPQDIIVNNLKINYAMKDKNPVDNVRFFEDFDATESFLIPRHKVSFLIPEHFQERYLRVYLREPTKEKMAAGRDAVMKFLRAKGCESPASAPADGAGAGAGSGAAAGGFDSSGGQRLLFDVAEAEPDDDADMQPAASAGAASHPRSHGKEGKEGKEGKGRPRSAGPAAPEATPVRAKLESKSGERKVPGSAVFNPGSLSARVAATPGSAGSGSSVGSGGSGAGAGSGAPPTPRTPFTHTTYMKYRSPAKPGFSTRPSPAPAAASAAGSGSGAGAGSAAAKQQQQQQQMRAPATPASSASAASAAASAARIDTVSPCPTRKRKRSVSGLDSEGSAGGGSGSAGAGGGAEEGSRTPSPSKRRAKQPRLSGPDADSAAVAAAAEAAGAKSPPTPRLSQQRDESSEEQGDGGAEAEADGGNGDGDGEQLMDTSELDTRSPRNRNGHGHGKGSAGASAKQRKPKASVALTFGSEKKGKASAKGKDA